MNLLREHKKQEAMEVAVWTEEYIMMLSFERFDKKHKLNFFGIDKWKFAG